MDCNPGTWCSRGRARRDFDHAQSVNFRSNPTPRGGHPLREHWRCRFGPGSPRPRHLLLMNGARRDRVDRVRDFNIRQKCSGILSSRPLSPGAARRRFSVYGLRAGALEIRHRYDSATGEVRRYANRQRFTILGPNRTEQRRASRRNRPRQKPAPTISRSRKAVGEAPSQLLQRRAPRGCPAFPSITQG